MRPTRLAPAPALFAGAAVLLVAIAVRSCHFELHDLYVFRTAGERFLAGAELYPPSDGFYAYRYAPGAALLFAPLAPLPVGLARALALAGIVGALLGSAALLHRRLPASRWYAAPLALVAVSQFAFCELRNVQVNAATLALVILAFAAEDEGHDLAAGALVSVAIALKVAPVVVALDWLVHRRWRCLAGVAIGLAAFAALPALTYGIEGAVAQHLAWIHSETHWSRGVVTLRANQSVWSLAARLGLPRAAGLLGALAVLGSAFTVRDVPLRRALVLLAVPLASNYGWLQNFIFAIPLLVLLLAHHRRAGWAGFGMTIGMLLLTYEVVGPHVEKWALDHTSIGLQMLALFALGRAVAWTVDRRHREAGSDPVAAPVGRAVAA